VTIGETAVMMPNMSCNQQDRIGPIRTDSTRGLMSFRVSTFVQRAAEDGAISDAELEWLFCLVRASQASKRLVVTEAAEGRSEVSSTLVDFEWIRLE
jgi:hypothetical protein